MFAKLPQSASRTKKLTIPEKGGGGKKISAVDPHPKYFGQFISGSGKILQDPDLTFSVKKVRIILENFSSNGPISLQLHTYFVRKS
jgi:hypothetical protein